MNDNWLYINERIFAYKMNNVSKMCSFVSSLIYLLILNGSKGYLIYEEEITRNDVNNGPQRNNQSFLYNLADEVRFYLYTRSKPQNGFFINNIEALKMSTFDKTKPTKFVTHGFRSSGFSDTCQEIKDEYLKNKDVNVIVMDWQNIASNMFYFIPAAMTVDVGQYYAKFIDQIVDYGLDPMDVHLIGHSLGAHISGFAGGFTKYKLGRISGLDPAFPSFGFIQLAGTRLNTEQAHFVDVIHTSAGTLGLQEAIGHVDFYPNGGTLPQPGCGGLDEIMQSCSHGRSWQYFKESIDPKMKFESFKSRNYQAFQNKDFNVDAPVLLGEYLPKDARGVYFLNTNTKSPFAISNEV